MTWATFDVWGDDEANGPEQVHVIPAYEEHDVSVDCWCGPRGDEGVFVHRDKLDRDPPEVRRKPADTLLSEQLEEARRWHLTAVNEKLAAQADAERLFTALDGYIMARITGTDLRDYDDLAERAARAHRALATDVPGKLDRTVLDPETGIEEPVTTGRIPDAKFVEPPLMPPAASPDERLREANDRHMSDHTETIKARLREDTFGDYVLLPAVHDAIDSAFVAGLQKHDGGLWELAFAAGRGAERERIVAALEADYRANVADGADGIYTDGLHDAWRLTVRRAKRDDLIKPVSGSSEPRKETT